MEHKRTDVIINGIHLLRYYISSYRDKEQEAKGQVKEGVIG